MGQENNKPSLFILNWLHSIVLDFTKSEGNIDIKSKNKVVCSFLTGVLFCFVFLKKTLLTTSHTQIAECAGKIIRWTQHKKKMWFNKRLLKKKTHKTANKYKAEMWLSGCDVQLCVSTQRVSWMRLTPKWVNSEESRLFSIVWVELI